MSKRGLLIPDLQVKPGVPLDHLTWLARFIDDKQFDPVIQIGDWGDFPSLSSYDRGKASAENKRLSKDWEAFCRSVDLVDKAFKSYSPRRVYCAGNHEERIRRYANDNPALDTLPNPTRFLAARGWETYEFLKVGKVEGVAVSHLFPRSLKGTVTNAGLKYGAPSAEHMVRANMTSCIAGHKPGFDYKPYATDTKVYHGLIAGSFYLHKETYNGPNGDGAWKGVVVLNQLRNGDFDPCPVRIQFLRERYGKR